MRGRRDGVVVLVEDDGLGARRRHSRSEPVVAVGEPGHLLGGHVERSHEGDRGRCVYGYQSDQGDDAQRHTPGKVLHTFLSSLGRSVQIGLRATLAWAPAGSLLTPHIRTTTAHA